MRKRGSEFNRNGSGRRDLARFVLMLLPGFMFLGLLAPAAVSVKPRPEERRYDEVSFRNPMLRQPIQAPRPPAKREATPAVEPLFTGARYVAGEEPPLAAGLPAVGAGVHSDEQIVLAREDAVDDYVSDSMFDQSVDSPVLSVDFTPLWNPAIYDRIPATISMGGYTMYDDFHGNAEIRLAGAPPAPIPEPEAGALVALGLVALALRARATNKIR